MKKNTGITLVSLVIIIIVMLILASTAIYTGIDSYHNAQVYAFVTKMQLIQETVNTIYQKEEYNEFKNNEALKIPQIEEAQALVAYNSAKSEIQVKAEIGEFCYFNMATLKEYLGLENIDMKVIISFKTREIISLIGIEYRDEIHYVQDNLPGGKKTVQYDDTDLETLGFILEELNFGLNASIKISNIRPNNAKVYYKEVGEYTGIDENGKAVYEEKQGSYWTEAKENEVKINKTGNYLFRVIGQEKKEYTKVVNVTLINSPKLSEGMIPIYWDETESTWIVTSAEEGIWYDYEEQIGTTQAKGTSKWANIMMSDGKYSFDEVEVGQRIEEYELGSMFVWIPRFMYEIEPKKDASGNDITNTGFHTTSEGIINIKFLKGNTNVPTDNTNIEIKKEAGNRNWLVHPCFQDGTSNNFENGEWDKEITGIWVAKFLSSEESGNLKIKSGKTALVSKTINDMFEKAANASYGVNNKNFDSHMIKNSEWGAIAYLTYSKYGRNNTKVTSTASYTTGNNYWNNILTSSTGNVYGIYDLVGAPYDCVAAYFEGSTATYGSKLVNAEKKYKNIYKEYSKNVYGDALYETSSQSTNTNSAWYADNVWTSTGTFLFRSGSGRNIFSISWNDGNQYSNASMRTVIIN